MLAVPDQAFTADDNPEDLEKILQKHILTSKVVKADIKNDAMRKAYDDTKVRFNVHSRDEKDEKQTVGFLLLLKSRRQRYHFFSMKR